MKTLIISVIIIGTLGFSAKAENSKASNKLIVAEADQQSPLSGLLTLYYDIKNSLVSGNANVAATKADEFVKAIANIDMKTLPDEEMKAFMPVKDKLAEDAKHIAGTKELSHQREHFAAFSANMITLAKGAKLSTGPVYEAYCPMKKAYWLSSEKAIKNPYYGSSMLTCGQVKETF
ncbi:MAG: DUF3347 domain-containing protein [Terrimonas sp.]|nr:DUF3347 domain-containing protein [Terrimonas sp.]